MYKRGQSLHGPVPWGHPLPLSQGRLSCPRLCGNPAQSGLPLGSCSISWTPLVTRLWPVSRPSAHCLYSTSVAGFLLCSQEPKLSWDMTCGLTLPSSAPSPFPSSGNPVLHLNPFCGWGPAPWETSLGPGAFLNFHIILAPRVLVVIFHEQMFTLSPTHLHKEISGSPALAMRQLQGWPLPGPPYHYRKPFHNPPHHKITKLLQ